MRIGEDFEKIQWQPFGFDFVEPNAMIGDFLIFALALFFAFRVRKWNENHPFFVNWFRFFAVFGISFLCGGLGHFLYNYLGLYGKYPSWYLGVFTVFFAEQAMISLLKNKEWRKRLLVWSKVKMLLVLVATTVVFITVDLSVDPSKGLRVTTINTTVGLLFALGFLGFKFAKTMHDGFHYFWLSILVMIPTVFFQSMKINFHQWFDRNDASHILLLITISLYFLGVKQHKDRLSSFSSH